MSPDFAASELIKRKLPATLLSPLIFDLCQVTTQCNAKHSSEEKKTFRIINLVLGIIVCNIRALHFYSLFSFPLAHPMG